MIEDKLQLRAILASAVGSGIMKRMNMKNNAKTSYWFFNPTEIKPDGE